MSAQDPRPAPRRRKLVLRKIADGAGATAPTATSSYTGPRPEMRPSPLPETMKSRAALTLPLESEPALEPEEIEAEEVASVEPAPQAPATTTLVSFSEEEWAPTEDAGAVAAMTPAAPREVPVPAASFPQAWAPPASPPVMPPRQAPPAAHFEPSPRPPARTSVAPVVATLPPVVTAPQLAPPRGSMSADSKLLAVGGALAAAMLLVATGVLLGQRSTAPSPSAAGTGSYPLVVDTKAPAATALPSMPSRPVEPRPAVADTPVKRVDVQATVDVQNLPTAARPRAQGWSVATARPTVPASSGWTVAPVVRPTTPAAAAASAEADTSKDDTPVVASAAATATAPAAASAAPPGDSFVQAVRDDIREDEARTK